MIKYSAKKKITNSNLHVISLYSNVALKLPKDLEDFQKQIQTAAKSNEFSAKSRSSLMLYGTGRVKRLLVLGLGEKKLLTTETFRESGGLIAKAIKQSKENSISINIEDLPKNISETEMAQSLTEGILMGLYNYNELKTDHEAVIELKELTFVYPNTRIENGIRDGIIIGTNINVARDLCNKPGNHLTPKIFAKQSVDMAKSSGLKVTVLGEKEMLKEQMGALLSVSKGSNEEAQFIILEHTPKEVKIDDTIVLVGKGLTFDAGGISLKPALNMHEMKMDMSGGAAVFAAMKTVAELNLPVHVVGLIPSSENLPNGRANKPGDVIKSRNGKTIEVLNTDAEGRLLLADALSYAEKYDPDAVIDLATLTGAMTIALGSHVTGMMGNNEALMDEIFVAGEESDDRVWQLPIYDDYFEQIKSDVADLANTGGKLAGSITAALFLSKFAESYHWAHLDIAGTAMGKTNKTYYYPGSNGAAVRLLTQFIKNRIK